MHDHVVIDGADEAALRNLLSRDDEGRDLFQAIAAGRTCGGVIVRDAWSRMSLVAVMDPHEHVQQPRGGELARGGLQHAVHRGRGERLQASRETELHDGLFVWNAELLKPTQQRGIDNDVQHPRLEEHLLYAAAVVGQVVVCDVDLFGHVMRV